MRLINRFSIVLLLAAALALSGGCSDDSGTTKADSGGGGGADGSTQDAGAKADVYPDLGALPDIGQKEPCLSEWVDAVQAVDKVTTGQVQSTSVGSGVTETVIDATAGGINAAKNNPYTYVSFADGGKRVDITDLTAKSSTKWDVAIKRAVIRVNGGDSGAGQGAVAILAGKKLADVTSVPPPVDFKPDEFIDKDCKVSRDPINNIRTAFGGGSGTWYEYSTGGKLAPKDQTYVIRLADGKTHIKLVVVNYYSPGGNGAFYTVRWSKL